VNSLEELFTDQIKDLHNAETQLTKALPKMAKAAKDAQLKKAFEDHLEETNTHIERLEQIAEQMGIKTGGKKCKAMEGLIAEGAEAMEQEGEDTVLDAGLVAAAQRVEHYEISAYTTLIALAEEIDVPEAVAALNMTLEDEIRADELLTEVRTETLYPAAPKGKQEKPAKRR